MTLASRKRTQDQKYCDGETKHRQQRQKREALTCPNCDDRIREWCQTTVKCTTCALWVHLKCSGLTSSDIKPPNKGRLNSVKCYKCEPPTQSDSPMEPSAGEPAGGVEKAVSNGVNDALMNRMLEELQAMHTSIKQLEAASKKLTSTSTSSRKPAGYANVCWQPIITRIAMSFVSAGFRVLVPVLCILAWSLLLKSPEVLALDFIMLALQHPPGYCRSTFQNRCLESNVKEHFTIHGLWPSLATPGSKLENCQMYEKFDIKELAPLRADLEVAWPSFKTRNPVPFWVHEWKRHGTCGVSVPALTGVFKFFNTTLELFKRFDPMAYLANDDILPSTKIAYPVEDVQRALENDLHSKVKLVCDRASGLNEPVLTEVRICLDEPRFRPVDCPGKSERCGRGKMFFLPLRGDGRLPSGTTSAAPATLSGNHRQLTVACCVLTSTFAISWLVKRVMRPKP